MTVDPGTPEGRRRARRGLRVGSATYLGLGAQSLLLVTAIREQTVGPWVTWALVLVTLVAAFVVEF
jgi:hypothetical protein